jgi:hypothetical protein
LTAIVEKDGIRSLIIKMRLGKENRQPQNLKLPFQVELFNCACSKIIRKFHH